MRKYAISSKEELINAIRNVNYKPNKLTRFLRKAYWAFFVYGFRPNHVVQILTRTGLLSYESRDRTAGRILEVYRHFDFGQIEETRDILKDIGVLNKPPEGTVVDVGGFLGMSSISFLLENVFSRAIAFEPNPSSYTLLKKNVSDNFLDNEIKYYNVALSDVSETLEFELSDRNYGDHRIRSKDGSSEQGLLGEDGREIITVRSLRFDDFITNEDGINLDDIKLIWMDVQGHEGRFLRGAREFLLSHSHVPTIMEFWPYAILRSGISKSDFITVVRDIYTHVMDFNGLARYDIDVIEDLFEKYNSPHIWTTLLLFNEE